MAEIININHETGDLTQYTSTVTDSGDLSVSTAAALIGVYGLSVLVDDTTAIYGQKDFTQLTGTAIRYRFYIDPNGLTMAGGDSFAIFRLLDGSAIRATIILNQGYTIRAFVRNDAGSDNATAFHSLSDAPHYVEVVIQRASSAVASDGSLSLYIDGVLQETVSGLDIYDVSQPNRILFGAIAAIDAGTSGTFYLDNLILRDDDTEIGAASFTDDLDQIDLAFDPQDDSHIVLLRTTPTRAWIYSSEDYGESWVNYQVGI